MNIIDGKAISEKVLEECRLDVEKLKEVTVASLISQLSPTQAIVATNIIQISRKKDIPVATNFRVSNNFHQKFP